MALSVQTWIILLNNGLFCQLDSNPQMIKMNNDRSANGNMSDNNINFEEKKEKKNEKIL